MSALLQVTDAHIAYGKVEAVRSVSLEVGDSEIDVVGVRPKLAAGAAWVDARQDDAAAVEVVPIA